jgi:dTDP-4-amino-4,6-dideoxygalactose transaminase
MSLVKPLYFSASLGKLILVATQKMGLLSPAVTAVERGGGRAAHLDFALSPALSRLLAHQLPKLNDFTRRRRRIANRYQREITSQQVIKPSVPPSTQPNWLRYPLGLKTAQGTAVLAAARAKHMLLGDWYDQPVTPCNLPEAQRVLYIPGSCPNAEQACGHVINLPTYPNLTDQQVSRIIAFINNL